MTASNFVIYTREPADQLCAAAYMSVIPL